MGTIRNQKFYTYPGGSCRVSDSLRFGGYSFTLKTLSSSQHFE